MTTHEDRVHEISDFLERPVFLETFSWRKTDVQGAILGTYRFPDRLLSYIGNLSKTRGFYGFRADVELIVKVNKQPFQGGLLMVSYCPNARYNTSKAEMHRQSIVTRSGAPRVVLNLKQDTEATLCVPYASPFIYYNLLTQEGNIGDFSISVYSVLSDVAGTGYVPVSVFARFLNVDLQFPTGSAPTFFGSKSSTLSKIDEFYSNPTDVKLAELKTFMAQSNTDTVMNVRPRALPHMTQPDTNDTAHVISLNQNSRLTPNDGVGSASKDEMSIAHICGIPNYYTTFAWSSSDTASTILWSTLTTPQPPAPFFQPVNGVIKADYIYTIAEMFALWHSSFTYTFRIASTPYHSGRLRIWFSPGTTSTANLDKNAMYTEIIDLKDATDFQFTVPWCHPSPYLSVKTPGTTSLGLLGVEILNPLVNPATVDSTINIVVERNASPDISFQLPAPLRKGIYNALIPPTTRTISAPPTKVKVVLLPPIKPKRETELDPNDILASRPKRETIYQAQSNVDQAPSQDQTRTSNVAPYFKRPLNATIADANCLSVNTTHVSELLRRSTKFYGIKFSSSSGNFILNFLGTGSIATSLVTHPALGTALPAGTYVTLAPLAIVRPSGAPSNDLIVLPVNTSVTLTFPSANVCQVVSSAFTGVVPTTVHDSTAYGFREILPDGSGTHVILATLASTIPNAPVNIQPHFLGTAYSTGTPSNITSTGMDNISYLAGLYTFMRGGVTLRIITDPTQYGVALDPANTINTISPSFGNVNPATNVLNPSDRFSIQNTINQIMNTRIEGFGEIRIPYFSNSFSTSINNSLTQDTTYALTNFTIPRTKLTMEFLESASYLTIYRSADEDFTLSYLSGPPLLGVITT